MVSRLEKLLLGITAAVAISCSEEAEEQCREGREWNGNECVVAEAEYDAGNDIASEETGPECYTHQECGDDYLCVEGSCESIEEACRIDESALCNEDSRFDGVYEMITNPYNCNYYQVDGAGIEEPIISLGFYDTENDCVHPGMASFSLSTRVCNNYEGSQNGNLLTIYNDDLFVHGYPIIVKLIKCTPTTILVVNNDNHCQALFEFSYVDNENHSCIE